MPNKTQFLGTVYFVQVVHNLKQYCVLSESDFFLKYCDKYSHELFLEIISILNLPLLSTPWKQ